jgi:putative PIN family toxin of toxin-antitoxin system
VPLARPSAIPQAAAMRAVIDTSVWVSAILNPAGAPARVLQALLEGQFSLVSSSPLLGELAEVLTRPRLVQRYNLTPAKTEALLLLLGDSELAEVTGSVEVCRDPDDNMVNETAINGHADVLVSRDDDLKRSPEVAHTLLEHGIQVLTVQRFLDALDEAASQANT